MVDGKGFRLADEIRYIQDKAADHDGRMVTIGQLILFSTDTGDAWLLDVTDHLAARLARDGDSLHGARRELPEEYAIGFERLSQVGGQGTEALDANLSGHLPDNFQGCGIDANCWLLGERT